MSENLAYNKQRSEDRVNDPRLPVRSGPWHCRDAGRHAAIFLILTFHWPKVLRTLAPRGATLTDHVRAPSNGFRAAVYDSIGPPLAFMTVNSGTRWLPEPETLRLKVGAGCRPRDQQLAISRDPSVGVQMVRKCVRRVEPSVD